MKRLTLTVAGLVIATLSAGVGFAQQSHQHGQQSDIQANQSEIMQADSGDAMKMMQMHSKMMGAMMDSGKMGRHSPLGNEFMKMLDLNGDGKTTSEEARTQLQKILEENDADGDGSLSIGEFEDFHSRLIREKMVDRFQHLDADGSGAVTAEEIIAPAENIERKQRKMKAMHSMKE